MKDIMNIESSITETQQKFKNITPQVQIGMSKVSLITEAEIDAITLNYKYDTDSDYQNPETRIISISRCFLHNPHDIDFQKNLDAKCLENGILPETVRPEIVALLQEKRNHNEFIRERRKEYTSYYYHPLILPFSEDNFYGFRIYGVVFYIFILVFVIESVYWFFIKKSKFSNQK
jgi:hypothetical protein